MLDLYYYKSEMSDRLLQPLIHPAPTTDLVTLLQNFFLLSVDSATNLPQAVITPDDM